MVRGSKQQWLQLVGGRVGLFMLLESLFLDGGRRLSGLAGGCWAGEM